MKKVLLILFMVLLGLGYFFSVRTNVSERGLAKREEKRVQEGLVAVQKQLTSEYPKTAEDVVKAHNMIMDYEYRKYMKDEYVELAIETLRLLYSDKLLDLNPKETQVASLVNEITKNKEKQLFIIKSDIISTHYETGNNSAIVKVTHFMNAGDVIREYHLINQNGEWKIDSWKNLEDKK